MFLIGAVLRAIRNYIVISAIFVLAVAVINNLELFTNKQTKIVILIEKVKETAFTFPESAIKAFSRSKVWFRRCLFKEKKPYTIKERLKHAVVKSIDYTITLLYAVKERFY
jgi:hypothetical protein